MPIVADASVAIRGDMSGFKRDLQGAQAETATFGQKLRAALSPQNVIGAAGLLGIGIGVRQLVGYAGDAAEAFSELQQTQRTTDEVFGNSASVIEDWAQRSAEAAGMSQRTVFQSASVMGQTLQNMGFSAEEAAEKTVMLQQRAAEMAIAFGQTPERAILAITAAMRGERDTIEKFGVSIKQADVNARVMALGLDTSTSAAKKNAEAIAILDLVMDQTSAQADRFANSQDDVAVKMAVAKARIDDFMTTQVGPAVASIQLGAIKVAEGFGDAVTAVGGFFDDMFNPEKQARIQAFADATGQTYNDVVSEIDRLRGASGRGWDETMEDLERELRGIPSIAQEQALAAVRAVGDAYVAGGPVVAIEAGKVAGMLPSEIKKRDAEIRAAGRENVIQFALGVLEAQNDPKTAFEVLTRLQEEEMTRGEEIAYLKGLLTSDELASGLEDGRPGVSLASDTVVALVVERLEELGVDAYSWGYNIGDSLAHGLEVATALRIRSAAVGAASAVGAQLRIESEPPDPHSPLAGITKWGGNIVKTIADGIYGELGTGSAAAGALAGALVPSVGMGAAGLGGGAVMQGGDTFILNVDGVSKTVDSEDQALNELREMAVWG